MSSRLLGPAWDATLPPMQKLVLLKLVDCANDDGSSCWPSVATIVGDTGASRRFVQRTLRLFEGDGLLEVVTLGGVRGNKSTEYQIVLAVLAGYVGASPRRGRPPDAGVPEDAEGRPPDAQPLIDPSERKKTRVHRFLSNDDVRHWFEAYAPALSYTTEVEAWADHQIAEDIILKTDDQEVSQFRGWVRNNKNRKSGDAKGPAGKKSEPTKTSFSEGLPDGDLEAWADIHKAIKTEIGDDAWETWLAPLEWGRFTPATAQVSAPTPFTQDWIKKNYQAQIEAAVTDRLGRAIQITFTATKQKAAAE